MTDIFSNASAPAEDSMNGWVINILSMLYQTLTGSHSGDTTSSQPLNLTHVLAALEQLTDEQLQPLYNGTGTSTRQQLIQFINASAMRVQEFEKTLMDFEEYRIKKNLHLYVPPILILVGTLGNLFSFIILRRKPMLKVSSYMYLAFLSVVDTLVLYVGLLRLWIGNLTGFDYQNANNVVCKFSIVLGYMASDLSVWLIIAVTVERYIVVCFPFKASSMCNVSRARKVIACLVLLMLALNFHFFFTTEIVDVGGDEFCLGSPNYKELVEEVWPWVDALVYSFLPFVIIMILNILIIREVAGARSTRAHLSGSDNDNSLNSVNQVNAQSNSRQRRHQTNEGSRLTALLLTVSFTFVTLTLPNNISLIITRFWNQEYDEKGGKATNKDLHRMAKFALASTIAELLMYTNHSINFFLYCATGNKFRQQVLDLLRCLRPASQRRNGPAAHSHSMRRTSQTLTACETSELMHVKRANGRRNSVISSESGDGMDKSDYSGFVLTEKPENAINGKGTVASRPDKSSESNEENEEDSHTCNGILQNNNTCGRHDKEPARKSLKDAGQQGRENSGKRYKFNTDSTGVEKKVGFVEPIGCDSHRNGRVFNNNGVSSRKAHSGKKKYKHRLLSKRGSFGSDDDLSLRDNEYILLQPTMRWRDSSSQS